jgi:multidrug resistance efflux pump
MTWQSRLKLTVGLIGVLVLVAGLTLVFNQRQAQATSRSAAIEAERFPVGTDYGGTVLERLVNDNERVVAGQALFTLQSATLQADLAEGLIKANTIAYSVTTDGVITLTAAVTGTVSDITTERGSFVQAGQVLATVDREGSLYVSAEYVLSSRDYARIEEGADVDILLPNQRMVRGTVESLDVETQLGQARTLVRVASDGLSDGSDNGLVARGTPVTARLLLRDDGILAGVGDGFVDFLRKIGL